MEAAVVFSESTEHWRFVIVTYLFSKRQLLDVGPALAFILVTLPARCFVLLGGEGHSVR